MAYSTPAQVRQILVPSEDGALPDEATHTAADNSDEQLAEAIKEADAMIDGYLGGIYSTPILPLEVGGPAPSPLPFWSRTIAAYLASLTYRGSQDFPDTDPIARRYKDVLSALKDTAGGQLRLNLPSNATETSAVGVGIAVDPGPHDLWSPEDNYIGEAGLFEPQRGFW